MKADPMQILMSQKEGAIEINLQVARNSIDTLYANFKGLCPNGHTEKGELDRKLISTRIVVV